MSADRKPIIAVIGGGECPPEIKNMAADIGRYIAQNGGVVICGGLGGVMEGVARGAKEGGGSVIGVIPSSNKNDANQYVDFVIATGLGESRNFIIVKTADAIIALPGKFGTLSEMAFALHAGKPIVGVSASYIPGEFPQFENPLDAAKKALELARK